MAMSITLDAARVRLVEGATATVADGLGVKARRLVAAADGVLLGDVWKDSSEWTSAPSDAARVRLVEGATATVADGLGVMARRLPAAAEGLDERTAWEKRFGNGEGKEKGVGMERAKMGLLVLPKSVEKAFWERTSVSSLSALSGSLASSSMSSASSSVSSSSALSGSLDSSSVSSLSALSGSLASPPISFSSASTVSPFAPSPRFCRYPSQPGLDLPKSINPTFFHALTSCGASFANVFADIHVVSL